MTTDPDRFALTGAAQGISREVALQLAGEGARVAFIDCSDLVEEVRLDAGAEGMAGSADLERLLRRDRGRVAGASAASTYW